MSESDPDPEAAESTGETETTTPMPAGARSATAAGNPTADETAAAGTDRGGRARRALNYAVLGGLALLALIAGLRFYLAASTTIDQWIAPAYRSLFHAAFNLATLLLAAAGVSLQVRRLR